MTTLKALILKRPVLSAAIIIALAAGLATLAALNPELANRVLDMLEGAL